MNSHCDFSWLSIGGDGNVVIVTLLFDVGFGCGKDDELWLLDWDAIILESECGRDCCELKWSRDFTQIIYNDFCKQSFIDEPHLNSLFSFVHATALL